MVERHEVMEVEDIAVFEALNNPLRFRILRRLSEPKSIRAIAEELDMPPTRLYYHFNLLEQAGVIEVVETRKVGAMLQRLYQSRAETFRPSPQLTKGDLEPRELASVTVGVVLDGARADAEEAVTSHFERLKAGDTDRKLMGALSRSVAYLSRERAEAIRDQLEKLMEEEFTVDDADGVEFGLSFAFFPLAGTDEKPD